MCLCSTDDHAVGTALDDPQVHVRIGLLRRALEPVALHISLRDREREIVGSAMLVEGLDPLEIGLIFKLSGHREQGEECVGADFFDQYNQRVALGGGRFDQSGAVEQVLGCTRDAVVGGVCFAVLFVRREFAVLIRLGHLVIDAGMFDGLADCGMCRHVIDPLASVPDFSTIAQ